MLSTHDVDLDQQAKYFRSHGMTALTLDRHKGRAVTYDVAQPGLNYRIDEMRSALGLIQLEKLPAANEKRKKLVKKYIELLTDTDAVSLPFLEIKNCEAVYHILPILLAKGIDRLDIIARMKEDGIQTSIHYPSFKDFTAFKDYNLNDAPVAEDIAKRELTLPLYPTMTIDEVECVAKSLKKALEL